MLIYCGAVAPEVEHAFREVLEDEPGAGLLAITSPDRIYENWQSVRSWQSSRRDAGSAFIEEVLAEVPNSADLITVIDGHPATLAWLGSVRGHRIYPLGVNTFGQSGDIVDLYASYGLDSNTIIEAVATACLRA